MDLATGRGLDVKQTNRWPFSTGASPFDNLPRAKCREPTPEITVSTNEAAMATK
jgi:hypothetical protein